MSKNVGNHLLFGISIDSPTHQIFLLSSHYVPVYRNDAEAVLFVKPQPPLVFLINAQRQYAVLIPEKFYYFPPNPT